MPQCTLKLSLISTISWENSERRLNQHVLQFKNILEIHATYDVEVPEDFKDKKMLTNLPRSFRFLAMVFK